MCSLLTVAHKIRYLFREGQKENYKKISSHKRMVHKSKYSLGYILIEPVNTTQPCGVKAVIYLSNIHFYTLNFGVGRGTNNRVELCALWITLKFALDIKLNALKVFGDSKFLMDWCNKKLHITNIQLQSILQHIKEERIGYEHLTFDHLYRELNQKVNGLSKEAIFLKDGVLVTQEFRREEELEPITFTIY